MSYNVSDGQGNFKSAVNSLNLAAVNDAPVLSGNKRDLTGGLQNKEATLYAIDLLAGFSDPEGNRLSIVNISADKGSLTKLSNQAWTLTPNKDYTGDIAINFEVSDGNGNKISANNTINIQEPNQAPVQVGEKTQFSLGNSNALSRSTNKTEYLIQSSDLMKGYSDPDGDDLSIRRLSASSGTLKNNGDQTWVLTQKKGSPDFSQLSYDIVDGKGGSTFVSNVIFFLSPQKRQASNKRKNTSSAEQREQITDRDTTLNRELNRLEGNQKRNRLIGTKRHDAIIGNGGADQLIGQKGNDLLNGGTGNDQLKGGSGDDELTGGKGKDKLWGQSGNDRFTVTRGKGYDVVADFRSGEDLIQLPDNHNNISIQLQGDDALLFEGKDLLAKVKDVGQVLQINQDLVI